MVNDGSNDKTGSVINRLCEIEPQQISAIHLKKNVGKAEAVRRGLLESYQMETDFVGFWDADFSAPLTEIDRLVSIIQFNSHIEAVLGSRVKLLGRQILREGHRHYLGRIFATVFSMILNVPIYDSQCGAKIFRVTPKFFKVISDPFITSWLFDVEIIARIIKYSEPSVFPGEYIQEEPLLVWWHISGSKIGIFSFPQILSETYRLWKSYRTY